MRKVTLGKSGLEVSAVGLGGIPIQRTEQEEAVGVIRRALELGVTFIDTAAGYGDSQKKIGLAIKGRRDGLVLASKSGQRTAEGILKDIDRARSEMGADMIDLYQLHGVSSPKKWEAMKGPGGALEGLIEAKEKGIIGHIGFTSHSLDFSLQLLDEPVFETIQLPFNLVTREPAEELIPKSRRLGLGFIVMKPLCGGQYDNANLAFKFLNAYPDLVAIPGIERAAEIEEIVPLVESAQTLQGQEKAQAEEIAASLGKLFCRRCGYCMPCPQGVPITTAMVFDGFLKRMPPERLATGAAKAIAEKAPLCVECGECESKCPYDLPIIETVKTARRKAEQVVGLTKP